jgi:hypothetical protein
MKALRTIREVGNLKNHTLSAGAIAAALVLFGANAWADNIATIEGYPAATVVTLNSSPVVTAILSAPGTLDGYTYTSYSFLAQDTSGSIDVFGSLSGLGYTPTVGDAITVNGTFSPYHQIPEIGTVTAISASSSGNPLFGIPITTIPLAIASGTGTLPQSLAGTLLTINNVTLYTDAAATTPVSGNFATHANTALYMKDSGGNIMELYVWASSYSTCGALGGTPIPTGTVNVTGFLSQSGTFAPEMTPFSITQVPEPSTLALVGLGVVGLLIRRRK